MKTKKIIIQHNESFHFDKLIQALNIAGINQSANIVICNIEDNALEEAKKGFDLFVCGNRTNFTSKINDQILVHHPDQNVWCYTCIPNHNIPKNIKIYTKKKDDDKLINYIIELIKS